KRHGAAESVFGVGVRRFDIRYLSPAGGASLEDVRGAALALAVVALFSVYANRAARFTFCTDGKGRPGQGDAPPKHVVVLGIRTLQSDLLAPGVAATLEHVDRALLPGNPAMKR